MVSLSAQIRFSTEVPPLGKHSIGYLETHSAYVNVIDGQLHLVVGNGSGQSPSKPTLHELKFLIATLQQAADLMEQVSEADAR